MKAPLHFRHCLPAAALLLATGAHAFTFTPEMRGQISYVKLELDETGHVARSTAITPDSTKFVTPDYGTTRLCRTDPEDRLTEPSNCRSYAIYIPSTAGSGEPMSVHLSLHGNGGFAEGMIGNIRRNKPDIENDAEFALDNTGLEGRYNELAERHHFIAVYPNGTISEASTVVNGRNWNDCRKLNRILRNGNVNTTYSDADDVGFIGALLDDLAASLPVDASRTFVSGYSNGAMMALRLYQELGARFTAFATVEGNQMVQEDINVECAPLTEASPKKPILLTFGDADVVVPYRGGCVVDGVQVPSSQVPSLYCQRGNLMSADQTIEYFTSFLQTDPPKPEDQLWPATWSMVNERVYTDGVPAAADEARAVNSYEEKPDEGGTTVYRHEVYGAGNSTGFWHVYGNGLPATGSGVRTQVRVKKIQNGGHTLSGINPISDPQVAALLGPKNLDAQVADELYQFFEQFTSGCGPRNVSLGPSYDFATTRPDVFPWQQTAGGANAFIQDDTICFTSRQSGAHLRGYLFAPAAFATIPDGSLPVVVIGPGSGNGQALYYLWSARELAARGYVVLVEDPQGLGRSETAGSPATCGAEGCPGIPFQNAENFVDGFVSALDFVESKNHPWLRKADLTRIGIAGHSLSARAATYVGGIDERVKAVVAWDNMAGDLHGDEGTPSGEGACADLIGGELPGTSMPSTPRVPTMGQASDANGTCNFEKNAANTGPGGIGFDPELKKAGFRKWRNAKVPAMELVFTGAAHADWAQSGQSKPQELETFQYYTRAWFDAYLNDDPAARTRLLATTLPLSGGSLSIADTTAKNGGLSVKFRSASYMPDLHVDCEDLLEEPCVPSVPLPPAISTILDQVIPVNTTTPTLAFTVSDLDTEAAQLTVTATSGNLPLVPMQALELGGEGADRSLKVTPAPDRIGTAVITLTVSDGELSSSTQFLLTVTPEVAAPQVAAASGGAWSLLGLLPLVLAARRRHISRR